MKILHIVGARPNFMKIAPLVREMSRFPQINQRIVHTGQHYDPSLSDIFFEELGIPRPDISLGVGSLPRLEQIAKIEELFDGILQQEQPDLVLVVGDVNSTIACTRSAKRFGVKVAHVEAGLRSFDWDMPEEHNRVETDKLSDLLYVTEQSGMENLSREKIPGEAVLVGNCMIDSLVHDLPRARASKKASELGVEGKRYFVTTFHRPSNVDTLPAITNVVAMLEDIAHHGIVIFPLHLRTKGALERFGLMGRMEAITNLRLTPPLGYIDFIGLVVNATAVISDSGGIQEETTYLGVPCLTMRENTERPVTIDIGSNSLLGTSRERLQEELQKIAKGTYKKGTIPPLWDGRAAERIVAHLLRHFA